MFRAQKISVPVSSCSEKNRVEFSEGELAQKLNHSTLATKVPRHGQ